MPRHSPNKSKKHVWGCWHHEKESVASQHVFILNKTLRKNDKSPLKEGRNKTTILQSTQQRNIAQLSSQSPDPPTHDAPGHAPSTGLSDSGHAVLRCEASLEWHLKEFRKSPSPMDKVTTFPREVLQAKNSSKSWLLVSLLMEMWR